MRHTDIAAINTVVALRGRCGHINAHLWDSSHFLSVNQSDLGVAKDGSIAADGGGAFLDAR